jgi:hypothetical protein
MRNNLAPLVLACALCAAAAPAAAQVEVTRITWEVSKVQGKNRAPFAPVTELRAAPEAKFTDHLRAAVTLRNPAPRAAEGLVLRYVLSLRLLKNGEPADKAFWAIPFHTEEIRVSKINTSSEKVARVLRFELPAQLNKLRSSGFSPSALKLEVMLNPRQGDEPASIMRESVLEILKP